VENSVFLYSGNGFFSTWRVLVFKNFSTGCVKENSCRIFPQRIRSFSTKGCGENQRQELIFAVMSRMLFCMEESPPLRATSILRME